MKKNQTSTRDGIQDFLCPFESMYITQGANGSLSHKGTMANDVRSETPGKKALIYAPCDIICRNIYSSTGQAKFQSKEKVRFANGRIDYATFMVAHDNTMDSWVGREFKQGEPFFQMGDKGYATGVHSHLQIAQSNDGTWFKNEFEIYKFNNEYDIDECCFMDETNILNMQNKNWKYLKDVPVEEKKENNNYITKGNMYVRTGPGTIYSVKLVKDLTEDGKKHATSSNLYAYAVYKAGTVFTALETIKNNYGTWARTPSGYVCLVGASGTVYSDKC